MALPCRAWPAAVIFSTRILPEVSLSSSRVSLTVRTAMRSGVKARASSILPPGVSTAGRGSDMAASIGQASLAAAAASQRAASS